MHEESDYLMPIPGLVHKYPAAWKADLALAQDCPIFNKWKIHICAKKNRHAGKHVCLACEFEWTEIYQNTRKEVITEK